MIKIDGILYDTIEDAQGAILIAKKIDIRDVPTLTQLDAPAATYLRVENNAALTQLDAPAATDLWVENNAALVKVNGG